MKLATFAPVNLFMTISFIAVGLFIATGLRSKREKLGQ